VAHWDVSRPSVPARNWAGHGYSVWQYTSSGHLPGISGRVDMDRLGTGLAKITVH
jgi:GH25 family lysozyme M1 (1,4-beta-N-acetylmuramidase)